MISSSKPNPPSIAVWQQIIEAAKEKADIGGESCRRIATYNAGCHCNYLLFIYFWCFQSETPGLYCPRERAGKAAAEATSAIAAKASGAVSLNACSFSSALETLGESRRGRCSGSPDCADNARQSCGACQYRAGDGVNKESAVRCPDLRPRRSVLRRRQLPFNPILIPGLASFRPS